ncbi:hypothetical protein HDU91_001543, partial [Kappamyces sp. JEL0680]
GPQLGYKRTTPRAKRSTKPKKAAQTIDHGAIRVDVGSESLAAQALAGSEAIRDSTGNPLENRLGWTCFDFYMATLTDGNNCRHLFRDYFFEKVHHVIPVFQKRWFAANIADIPTSMLHSSNLLEKLTAVYTIALWVGNQNNVVECDLHFHHAVSVLGQMDGEASPFTVYSFLVLAQYCLHVNRFHLAAQLVEKACRLATALQMNDTKVPIVWNGVFGTQFGDDSRKMVDSIWGNCYILDGCISEVTQKAYSIREDIMPLDLSIPLQDRESSLGSTGTILIVMNFCRSARNSTLPGHEIRRSLAPFSVVTVFYNPTDWPGDSVVLIASLYHMAVFYSHQQDFLQDLQEGKARSCSMLQASISQVYLLVVAFQNRSDTASIGVIPPYFQTCCYFYGLLECALHSVTQSRSLSKVEDFLRVQPHPNLTHCVLYPGDALKFIKDASSFKGEGWE